MKPILVVGLGNPLAGDDGMARHLLEELEGRIPDDVEILWAGTDLLPHAEALAGREVVVLVDAVLDGGAPGRVRVWDRPSFTELDRRAPHAHHLSVVRSLELLMAVTPELRSVRFLLFGVGVPSIQLRPSLSPELSRRMPEVAGRLLDLLVGMKRSARP